MSTLMQFDLRQWNKVRDSKKIIVTDADAYGQLQLAPDGKIYVGNILYNCDENTYFHVISEPNQAGQACGFAENAFSLLGSWVPYFLPNFMTSVAYKDPCESEIKAPEISLSSDTVYIVGSTFPQVKVHRSHSDLLWSDGKPDSIRYFGNEGTYSVKASNPCGVAYDSVVVKRADIFIPNVVTANDDQRNDTFVIQNGHLVEGRWLIRIYNRQGQMVWMSEDYKNDWKGSGLSPGIYYYVLSNTSYDFDSKGWINLIW